MKRIYTTVFVLFCTVTAFAQNREPARVMLVPEADSLRPVAYDIEMLTIVTNKCLGCHSPSARNEDAREALQWEQLQNMDKLEAYAILDEMLEVLDEGSMPPEKMVQRFPHLKLTDQETAVLKAWAESTLAKLEE